MLQVMRIVVAALLASSVAHAGVEAELAAGGGTETGSPGYTTASATISADYSHPSAPLYRRGLAFVDDDGGVWVWTGAQDVDHDGLHADVSATALGTSVIGGAHASARGLGWELDLGLADQPVGDLREQFWRSGRDIVATTVGLQMPPEFTFGDATHRVGFADMDVSVTDRTLRAGAARIDGGLDATLNARMLSWRQPRWSCDFAAVHVTGHELIASASASSTTGTSTDDAAFDLVSIEWRAAPDLVLRARGGVDSLQPVAVFTDTVNPDGSHSSGTVPGVVSPRYWVEAETGAGVTISGGSWARLDPTGNAADVGELAAASYLLDRGRLHVHASAQGGQLRRAMVGALAPAGIAPVGTRMWMGRGELAASYDLARGLDLATTAWVERSDRDDPRWLVPASGTLATHAGADISARWHLARHHRT